MDETAKQIELYGVVQTSYMGKKGNPPLPELLSPKQTIGLIKAAANLGIGYVGVEPSIFKRNGVQNCYDLLRELDAGNTRISTVEYISCGTPLTSSVTYVRRMYTRSRGSDNRLLREGYLNNLRENVIMLRQREGVEQVILLAQDAFEGYSMFPEFTVETLQTALEKGADIVIIQDTNGTAAQEDVQGVFEELKKTIPGERLGFFPSNQGESGLENALAAADAGVGMLAVPLIHNSPDRTDLRRLVEKLYANGYEALRKEVTPERLDEFIQHISALLPSLKS